MINSQPLISVIMGIYNCADTLAESLDSLLAQTYQNFELFVFDNGSTDNSWEVIDSFSDSRMTKIRLIISKYI